MAQEALEINRDPYVTTTGSALISLPDLFLGLYGIDSGPENPIALVKSPIISWMILFWDMLGAPKTRVM